MREIDWGRNWYLVALIVGVVGFLATRGFDSGVGGLLPPLFVGAALFGVLGVVVLVASLVLGPHVSTPSARARAQAVGLLVAVVALVFAPAYIEWFPFASLFKLTSAVQFMIVIVGLNLLTGFTGQISLGQGAFFAIGGYTLGVLFRQSDLPWGVALVIAPVIAFVVGMAVGVPALRFSGPYLALATLSLAVMVSPIAKRFDSVTGGVQGVPMYGQLSLPGFVGDHADKFFYYLSLAAFVVAAVVTWNLIHGRIGRALVAIRDNEIAATAMGVHVARFKVLAFGTAAAFAGFAGALNAATIQFVSPDQYSVLLSIRFLVGAVIGGIASVSGAFFGGVFMQFIADVTSDISRAAPDAVQAVILILFMYAMRGGFAGFIHQVWQTGRAGFRLRKVRHEPSLAEVAGGAPQGERTPEPVAD